MEMAKKLLLLTLLVTVAAGVMHASTINGSIPFSGENAAQNGADLSVSTSVWDMNTITSGAGLGDYSVIPLDTPYGPFTLDLGTVGVGGGFSLTNATWGSFSATSGEIVTRTPSFLDVYLRGMYSGLPGFDATDTSLRLSFTQSGNSLSVSGTLNSPPVNVPEPGTLGLLGSAVLGLAAVLRRKLMAS